MPSRIQGKNCTVVFGTTTVTDWTKYTLETTMNSVEARAANAGVQQKVTTYLDATLSLEGWRGGTGDFIDTVTVGDEAATITGDNFPDMTGYGKWRIVSISIDQGEDPGTWTMNLESGFID